MPRDWASYRASHAVAVRNPCTAVVKRIPEHRPCSRANGGGERRSALAYRLRPRHAAVTCTRENAVHGGSPQRSINCNACASEKGIRMANQRTTTGRGTTTRGSEDITRDSMMRDDTTAGTETAYNKNADNDYWTSEGPGPKVMAADTLQGDAVYNEADEKLGEITDIMIDVPTGRVAYAVMSVGGVLGDA